MSVILDKIKILNIIPVRNFENFLPPSERLRFNELFRWRWEKTKNKTKGKEVAYA